MKRVTILVLAIGMLVGMMGASALAQEGSAPPLHGHILVLGLQLDADEMVTGYRRCVDVARGRALPLAAHHQSIHTGRAGEALWAAGHATAPTAPLSPIRDCAHFAELVEAGLI